MDFTNAMSLRTIRYGCPRLGRTITATDPDADGRVSPSAPVRQFVNDNPADRGPTADLLGNVTQYAYNSLGQATSITDAASGQTTFTYDEVGNQLSLTDPVGNTTSWTYDGLNRVTEETNELGFTRHFSYDALGNLIRRVDRNGRVRQFQYDALGRVTGETWYDTAADADSAQNARNTIQYSYHAANRLLSESDAFSSYSYVYDALDRVTSETVANLGAPVVVFTTGYDRLDNLRSSFSATIGGVADFQRTYHSGNGVRSIYCPGCKRARVARIGAGQSGRTSEGRKFRPAPACSACLGDLTTALWRVVSWTP